MTETVFKKQNKNQRQDLAKHCIINNTKKQGDQLSTPSLISIEAEKLLKPEDENNS